MSEKPINGDPATALATVVKPRPKADLKAQDWHRAGIVIAGFFALAALGFLMAMVTTYYPRSYSSMNAMLGDKSTAGKVISYSGPDKECRQQVFDNATGQMTKPEPCDLSVLESNGVTAASSPRNRLDAISKAFSGR